MSKFCHCFVDGGLNDCRYSIFLLWRPIWNTFPDFYRRFSCYCFFARCILIYAAWRARFFGNFLRQVRLPLIVIRCVFFVAWCAHIRFPLIAANTTGHWALDLLTVYLQHVPGCPPGTFF